MKTIKLILIFLFTGILVQTSLSAKEPKTTMKLLTAHTWIWEVPSTSYSSEEFIGRFNIYNNNTFTSTTRYLGLSPSNYTMYYYLSDVPEYKFDESKIGKVQNGKYIIRVNLKNPELVNLAEIIELTDKILKVKAIRNPNNSNSSGRTDDSIETFLPYEGKLE